MENAVTSWCIASFRFNDKGDITNGSCNHFYANSSVAQVKNISQSGLAYNLPVIMYKIE